MIKSGNSIVHIVRSFSSLTVRAVGLLLIMLHAFHFAGAQAIAAPRLKCVVNSPNGSTTTLTWDAVPNQPCGTFVCYLIYQSATQAGPYVLDTTITAQSATTWTNLGAANNTAYYYIKDSFTCPGASYLSSDTIENEANPKTPVITGVSVQSDGSIILTWLPSTSPQTAFYVIFLVTPNGTHLPVDTVWGRFNDSYRDTIRNPYASVVEYSISAGDTCPNNQLSAYNTSPQQSILLGFQAAQCNPNINLSWTKYINLPGGVEGYNIYVSRNDSAYVFAGFVDSNTLTYPYSAFNNGDSLQIYVDAVGIRDTTFQLTSNYERFRVSVTKPPAFVYITDATVDTSNNSVDLTWLVDSASKLLQYQPESSQDSATYLSLAVKPVGVLPAHRFAHYADSTATPQYYPYYYEVLAYDSCLTYTTSPAAEIISLSATLSDYYQITLGWNYYQLYGATVIRYNLYRGIDDGTGYHLIQSFSPTTTTDIDSVFKLLTAAGQFCYFIEGVYAIHLPNAGYTDTLKTYSNIACLDHRPIIYIPNAFVYGGVNNFFKPRIIFGDPIGYSMTIWNRYGGKIFETHDSNASWDGTHDGSPVEQGGYTYLIQFTALDGTAIERKGIVLFIRK